MGNFCHCCPGCDASFCALITEPFRVFVSHDNLNGRQFRALYGGLLLLVIYLGFAIPDYLRARGRALGAIDSEQAAYLSGGEDRFFELVIVRYFPPSGSQ